MIYLLYFLIAIGATTVGSLTGMGGGVIIKPLMDLLGGFDVETIGVLSSITVFAMSIVSVGKQIAQKAKIDFGTAIPWPWAAWPAACWGSGCSSSSWPPPPRIWSPWYRTQCCPC